MNGVQRSTQDAWSYLERLITGELTSRVLPLCELIIQFTRLRTRLFESFGSRAMSHECDNSKMHLAPDNHHIPHETGLSLADPIGTSTRKIYHNHGDYPGADIRRHRP